LDNSEQEGRAVTKILDEVLAANAKYAENFADKGNLPLPPSRHFAILTCMDARLDPAKYAGLSEGDAHVIGMLAVARAMTPSGHW
jgi:carbonic anhydrase